MIFGTYTAYGSIVRASDGACIPPDPRNSDYQQALAAIEAGDTITPWTAPPIDLKAYAANKRWQIETGGITVAGAQVATTRDDQAMITGAFAYAQANPSATINFKAASGWVALSSQAMTAIGLAVGAHVQTCFAAEAAIDADIAVGTIITATEIDSDSRWPASLASTIIATPPSIVPVRSGQSVADAVLAAMKS